MKHLEACHVCPVFLPLLFSFCLNPQEDDITKMLAATTHIGSDNSETTMEQYIFKKKTDGVNIINLKKTWEKLVLAARAIAAVENPQVHLVLMNILGEHNADKLSSCKLFIRALWYLPHGALPRWFRDGCNIETFPPSLEFADLTRLLEAAGHILIESKIKSTCLNTKK